MDIHEYQAKELLSKFGVPIPRGGLAYSPEQATYRASEIGGTKWVVKAQIHSGARGKAGGIKVCATDTRDRATQPKPCSARKLVTHQTGPAGKLVSRLYIEEATDIDKEIYLGFVMDRAAERIMVVASAAGGMEIEEISAQAARHDHPRHVSTRPSACSSSRHAKSPSASASIRRSSTSSCPTILGCYRAFRDLDATMVEINPLVITKDKTCSRSTPRCRSTRTPCSAARISPSCATRARKIRARPTPATAALPTSASTATSAASSTAPASPWPRWT